MMLRLLRLFCCPRHSGQKASGQKSPVVRQGLGNRESPMERPQKKNREHSTTNEQGRAEIQWIMQRRLVTSGSPVVEALHFSHAKTASVTMMTSVEPAHCVDYTARSLVISFLIFSCSSQEKCPSGSFNLLHKSLCHYSFAG